MTAVQPKGNPDHPSMTWTGTISNDMKTLDLNLEMTQNPLEWQNRTKSVDSKMRNRLGK